MPELTYADAFLLLILGMAVLFLTLHRVGRALCIVTGILTVLGGSVAAALGYPYALHAVACAVLLLVMILWEWGRNFSVAGALISMLAGIFLILQLQGIVGGLGQ